MTDHDDIEQAAALWVARRDGGQMSGEDEAAFAAWLDASIAHRVTFLRLNATWMRAQRLAALEHRDDLDKHQPMTRRGKLAAWGALLAACIALAAALGWYSWQYSQSIYRTQIGALQSVPLADGSQVTLNTDSTMYVDISGRQRKVELRRGEAYFDVAHDSSRPFVVRSGTVSIEVVGTKFAVHRTSQDVRILVSDGHVRVRAFASPRQEGTPTDLSVGDVAVLSSSGIHRHRANPDELDAALSWRRGQLVFRDTPLMDAVAEFNRYHLKQVIVADPQLASVRIGGTFRTANAEGFLRLLQEGFEVHVKAQDEAILLTRR